MTREEAIMIARGLRSDFKITSEIMVDFCNTVIKALEQEPKTEKVIKMRDATPEERELVDKYIKSISKPTVVDFWDLDQESILEKIKGYIDHIRNTGMGKKKSLEFIEKFIEGLKAESEDAE